ncbi:thioredoxin domain-containing protein [Francisella sp. 19X1-34]|uniref:thioredoxin domain-containing protein n=1 Tax=Francisella sp. 19X1-34 TaxID=3087177 RepID=UPI002E33E0ED|nr:thioredoxin domain-containing protein [Francisella sp. 19X1-34]MED7788384.1 thioredoxin domain-containing protein [Francisella sp. 19X1-34]
MKKILAAILGISALVLSSCSSHQEINTSNKHSVGVKRPIDYARVIAIPAVVNQLLNDEMTPTIGPKDAKKAVVVFYDYGCYRCTKSYPKMVKLVSEEPNVKFIFKAYPSSSRADNKVPNYASLVANESYLQGGPELFAEYNKIIYGQREANGKLTIQDVDNAIKQLGIATDKPRLKRQAEKEELRTKRVAKLIGFEGPSSYIVLPTDLAKMNADQLEANTSKISVIAIKDTSNVDDYHKLIDQSMNKIREELNNIK